MLQCETASGFLNAMERSGRQEIASMLTYRQIGFSGRIASPPSTEVRRHCVFRPASLVKPFGPRLLNSRSPEEAQRILRGPRCTNLQPMLTRPYLPTQNMQNFGAILLFRTASIERLCALPTRHPQWSVEILNWKMVTHVTCFSVAHRKVYKQDLCKIDSFFRQMLRSLLDHVVTWVGRCRGMKFFVNWNEQVKFFTSCHGL